MVMLPSWLWFKTAFAIRSLCAIGIATLIVVGQCRAQAANSWDRAVESLAAQIAEIAGPGPVALSLRNLSSIHADQVSLIRKSLEASLKVHGVTAGGSESANAVRVTLSQNVHEQLWVAEIVEGNETKVTMVEFGSANPEAVKVSAALTLRRQTVVLLRDQILAALEIPAGLLILEPEQAILYAKADSTWKEVQRARMNMSRPLGRDPRGILLGSAKGSSFDAWLPGVHCSGSLAEPAERSGMKIACSESDDPWAVTQPRLDLLDSASSPTFANV